MTLSSLPYFLTGIPRVRWLTGLSIITVLSGWTWTQTGLNPNRVQFWKATINSPHVLGEPKSVENLMWKPPQKKRNWLYKYKIMYLFQYWLLFPKAFTVPHQIDYPAAASGREICRPPKVVRHHLRRPAGLVPVGVRSGEAAALAPSAPPARAILLSGRDSSALRQGCACRQIAGTAWDPTSSLLNPEQYASHRLIMW